MGFVQALEAMTAWRTDDDGLAARSAPLGRAVRGGHWSSRAHRVLGLSPEERDPVTIILAAQIRLRRWRRCKEPAGEAALETERVRVIVRARDAMLQAAFSRLTSTGVGPTPAG